MTGDSKYQPIDFRTLSIGNKDALEQIRDILEKEVCLFVCISYELDNKLSDFTYPMLCNFQNGLLKYILLSPGNTEKMQAPQLLIIFPRQENQKTAVR